MDSNRGCIKSLLQIGWWFLLGGLLLTGLSAALGWPILVTVISLTAASFGLLIRLSESFLQTWAREGISKSSFLSRVPALLIALMLFGVSPVLLTLSFVFKSTYLLRITALVAGSSGMLLITFGLIRSWVQNPLSALGMLMPENTGAFFEILTHLIHLVPSRKRKQSTPPDEETDFDPD